MMWLFTGIVTMSGLIIFMIIIGIVISRERKNAEEQNDFEEFYFGKRTYRGKDKQTETLGWSYVLGEWLVFCVVFSTAFLIAPLLFDVEIVYEYVHNHIQFSLEFMFNSCLSIILSVSVIKEWNRNSYLTFSIDDILSYYRMPKTMFSLIFLMFVSLLLWLLVPMSEKLAINAVVLMVEFLIIFIFVFYLCHFGKMIWIIFNTILGTRMEQKILNNLYRDFWYKKRKKVYGKWKNEGIEDNIAYLADQYKKSCKKLHILEIDFDTNLNRETGARYENVKTKSIRYTSLFIFIYSFIVISPVILQNCFKNVPIKIAVLIGVPAIFVLFIRRLSVKTDLGDAFVQFCYGKTAYCLKVASNKKIFISELAVIPPNKYTQYIKSLKNLIAYFDIALENDKKVKKVFDTVKEESNNDEDFDIALMIMDYLYFKEKESHIMQLDIGNIPNIKQDIAKAVIRDIERVIKNGRLSDEGFEMYKEKLSELEEEN